MHPKPIEHYRTSNCTGQPKGAVRRTSSSLQARPRGLGQLLLAAPCVFLCADIEVVRRPAGLGAATASAGTKARRANGGILLLLLPSLLVVVVLFLLW